MPEKLTEKSIKEKEKEQLKAKISAYKPSQEEEAARNKVYDRYKNMKHATDRTDSEGDWDTGDKAYRLYTEARDPDDWRTSLHLPIEFSIIETELQETIDRKPRPVYKPIESSDVTAVDLLNDIADFTFIKGIFDFQYYLARKEALIRGTGAIMEYYREDKRVVKKLTLGKDKEGNPIEEYTPKEITDFDDVYAEYIPIEDIYIDPAAKHIDYARDAIRREILNINEFHRRYEGKRGFIEDNIQYVTAGGDTGYYTYYEPPRDIENATDVEVLHYWNRAEDLYIVVANDVAIRNAPLPYPHKEIPIILLYCYKLPNKLYGLGIPKIVEDLVGERNEIRNLRIDYQKMGINKMFLYSDALELEDIDLVTRPHGAIPVSGNLPIDQVIRPIEYGDIKPSGFREEEILIEDIRRTTGIDDRVQGLNVGGTATEAAILKESSMKRIEAKMKFTEMDGLIRLGRLRKANIQFFYSIPRVERITKSNGEETVKKQYRTIRIEGKEYTLDEKGNLTFEEKEGYSFFKINKQNIKFIEGEFDVEVAADTSAPLSKPLQQAKITEMFNTLSVNPLFANQLDARKSINSYIKYFDEKSKDWLKKEALSTVDQQLKAEMENRVMASGQPLPPTPGATPEHTIAHVSYGRSVEFQQLGPTLQDLIEVHIKGESAMQQGEGGLQGQATQQPQPGMAMEEIVPGATPPPAGPTGRGEGIV